MQGGVGVASVESFVLIAVCACACLLLCFKFPPYQAVSLQHLQPTVARSRLCWLDLGCSSEYSRRHGLCKTISSTLYFPGYPLHCHSRPHTWLLGSLSSAKRVHTWHLSPYNPAGGRLRCLEAVSALHIDEHTSHGLFKALVPRFSTFLPLCIP